jgi:hypothetical protein
MINRGPSYSWSTVVCAKMKDVANLNSVSTGLHQIEMLNIVYRFLVLALAGTPPDSSSRDGTRLRLHVGLCLSSPC